MTSREQLNEMKKFLRIAEGKNEDKKDNSGEGKVFPTRREAIAKANKLTKETEQQHKKVEEASIGKIRLQSVAESVLKEDDDLDLDFDEDDDGVIDDEDIERIIDVGDDDDIDLDNLSINTELEDY